MRQMLIAVFLLFAAPAWAETRDPGNYFFQSTFGDLKAELAGGQSSRGSKAFSCFSKWTTARFARA